MCCLGRGKTKMRIMYLIFSFTVGGTERLVADICNEMASRNNDVYLYVVNDLLSEQMLCTISNRVHLELQKRKPGSGGNISTSIKIARFVQANKINIIHCNSLNAPELLFLKFILYHKTKVFYTVHDVGQYQNLKKWRVIYRNILCNKIIAISESVKKDLLQCGATFNKVSVVYNAINLKKFKVNKKQKNDNKNIIIGNVARFVPEKKGQDILIDAMSKVIMTYQNVICRFAGGYDPQHRTAFLEMKEKIKKTGMDKNIEFLGNVDDIPSFLSEIDVFVLPSRFEGFGISLIEAMAMGIPCIASNLNGPAEIIGNNEHGHLFNVSDSGELAQIIIEVVKNIKREKEQAQNNVVYVHENFDIKVMCNTLCTIYKK